MNQRVKRLVTSGLSLLLLAFFSIELTASATRLECGLVSLLGEERTSAQSSRLRKSSLSLWERAGVRDEVSERSKTVRRSGFIPCYARPLTLSQRERELFRSLLDCALVRSSPGRDTSPHSKRVAEAINSIEKNASNKRLGPHVASRFTR